jgi:hypothetical protein
MKLTTGSGAAGDETLQFGIVDGSHAWIQPVQPGVRWRNLALNPNGGNVRHRLYCPRSKIRYQL